MRYVYVLRNLVNDKVYVGQTKNPCQRKSAYFFNARKGSDKPLYRSIRKHGEENFLFEIIEECEDTLINKKERYWVSHYDSFNSKNGYNLISGGNQRTEMSQQIREKPVQKIDEKGNVLETYSSIKEASQLTGIKNITSVCKGRRSKAGGCFWRYA